MSSARREIAIMPQPIIRTRSQHSISRRDIDPDALKVVYRLARAGYIAYLVGGSVRDLLLGRQPKDFDVGTDAHPRQIKRLFRNCFLIGRRFRLAHIKFGDKVIETSTFRRAPPALAEEQENGELLQREDNTFGTPEEDARRRDFTINGLFYDVEAFCVIDYVNGLADLERRQVRSIGDPNIRFREDPVRMIRAARFAARLDFAIDPETYDAILRHRAEISKASPARLYEEILRLFPYGRSATAFRLLHETGLLAALLPKIVISEQDAEQLWRLLAALDRGDTVLAAAEPALNLAALFYPAVIRESRGAYSDGRALSLAIQNFALPLWRHYRVPGRIVDQIQRMYLSQWRFDRRPSAATRSLQRFVLQDVFPLALALAEIRFAAEGRDLLLLKEWRELYEERLVGAISRFACAPLPAAHPPAPLAAAANSGADLPPGDLPQLAKSAADTAIERQPLSPASAPASGRSRPPDRPRRRRRSAVKTNSAVDGGAVSPHSKTSRFDEPSPAWEEEI
ncbi:MAG: polynucleotide adenylyltransferase PcnB [Planctomycetota bacterium]|nr:polynucleotide adenylyltransferase PcnB [Planctomycetota bacterium]